MIMPVRDIAHRVYARRLRRRLTAVPRHVAIVTDGNQDASRLEAVLGWCAEVGIPCVTVYATSGVVEAVRRQLALEAAGGASAAEVASRLAPDDIDQHLYTPGLPDPDLYLCDVHRAGFRKIDFLRALRAYEGRLRGSVVPGG